MRLLKALPGILGPLLAVLAGMALLLRAADYLPTLWLRQVLPEVERFASVRELEARLGTKLLLPAYFPEYLAWPPARIELYHWPGLEVRIFISGREHQQTQLIIYQLLSAEVALPADPGLVLAEKNIEIRGQRAQLAWIRNRAGQNWCRLGWQGAQGRMVLLTKLPAAELVRIAQSMRAQQ